MDQTTDNLLVFVAQSTIHGKGLFAARQLTNGQLIGCYEGPVVEDDGIYVLWIEDVNDRWIGYKGVNSMRFMNHSDTPNAEMHGLDCYALADIPTGQEITIDYGWNETN